MNMTFDGDEVNSLITILQTKGVCYLIGSGSPLSQDDAWYPFELGNGMLKRTTEPYKGKMD